ncbi:MAG TPA: hypothetical protein VLT33_43115 [Labilithrix sp.]|nr:hypothetical protein [Labilithrix sp.]
MKRRTISLLLVTGMLAAIACNDASDPVADPGSSGGSSGSSGSSGGSSGSSGSSGTSGGPVDSSVADTSTPTDAGDGGDAGWVGPDGGIAASMTFFVTSKGNGKGGDFRAAAGDADGLAGADAFCKSLANAVSPVLGAKSWKAYLSTNAVTARSRIGAGPWYNAKGVMIASSVANLHDEPAGTKNALSETTNLDELGNKVPIAGPNVHDILTGATTAGLSGATNCANWTSSATNGQAIVGHANRNGGGDVPTSWNAAHQINGCKEPPAAGNANGTVASGGGRGSIYCFVP